mmetsp:Transcript_17856/g.40914  ORF Transcript_17856/g.40914 Transcript_17856/m.40914 type:complete len:348 (-) Transcript_17856:274-1317(-)
MMRTYETGANAFCIPSKAQRHSKIGLRACARDLRCCQFVSAVWSIQIITRPKHCDELNIGQVGQPTGARQAVKGTGAGTGVGPGLRALLCINMIFVLLLLCRYRHRPAVLGLTAASYRCSCAQPSTKALALNGSMGTRRWWAGTRPETGAKPGCGSGAATTQRSQRCAARRKKLERLPSRPSQRESASSVACAVALTCSVVAATRKVKARKASGAPSEKKCTDGAAPSVRSRSTTWRAASAKGTRLSIGANRSFCTARLICSTSPHRKCTHSHRCPAGLTLCARRRRARAATNCARKRLPSAQYARLSRCARYDRYASSLPSDGRWLARTKGPASMVRVEREPPARR